MIDLLEQLPAEERKQLRAGLRPAWVAPMLATLLALPSAVIGAVSKPRNGVMRPQR